jgi:DNA-binding MarR family transcriptional regulator
MNDQILDSVTEDLFSIPPLIGNSIRKKVLRTALENISEDITPPHFIIMKTLEKEGILHVSEIGERLGIPKPQMTHLLDKLEELDIVERKTDSADRRALNIMLTGKGLKTLQKHDRLINEAVKTTLSRLTGDELKELSLSLRKLREILSKLE